MSFTSSVKNEVSKLNTIETENIAELSALIRNIGILNENSIKIITENSSVARRIFGLLKDIYGVTPRVTVRKGYNYNKNLMYLLEVKYKMNVILEDLSLYQDNNYLVIPKEYMIYIKEAEKIGDFLRIIGASQALLYYEDIRIYRDHKNMTNRLNNCEQANIDKMIMSASKEVKEIELLEETGTFDLLDEKVKEVAKYRKKYPEASLLELSEIISIETGNAITKSGVHHRLKKIHDMIEKIKKN